MDTHDPETPKQKNDPNAKGRPLRGLSPRAALMLILLAVVVMWVVIIAILEKTSPPSYPADRLVYNSGTTRYALDLRTGERQSLGLGDEGRDVLSPDGRWWARWVVDGELGDSWLVLTNVETGETHRPLERRFYGTSVRVNWSPDSQWIAFHGVPDLASPESAFELWRVNVQTNALEQLTDNQEMDADPDFSPDGTRLVFTTKVKSAVYLRTLTLATGVISNLPGPVGYGARWSPDGLWIVFTTSPYKMGPLWVVRADGTGTKRVVEDAWWSNFGWEQ